jgi:beta-fructofuranosidase
MQTYPNPAIAKAMRSLAEAAPRAEADPTRPVYHFRPPAQWMNDPNGTIYHNGYYHVFYQLNPYSDSSDYKHWGHTRSTDLVHWEHLPIALWPSAELGERDCYSGCAWINGQGHPTLFYTKVAPRGEGLPSVSNEQWAATGDADLLTWQKHPANPILSLETHGGPSFEGTWRDPFIFAEEGRTFMVLGAALEEEATVALYEAEDTGLVKWTYRGLLCRLPRTEVKFFECPNFFKLREKWVLLFSPYQPVEYMIGSFDLPSLQFKPEQRGILDRGYGGTANYYATNILFDDQGRCILFAWIRGFEAGRGWNGCLALPRLLSVGGDGDPRQVPVPELQKLRRNHTRVSQLTLNNGIHRLDHIAGDTLEIQATFDLGEAQAAGLKVRCATAGQAGITLRYDRQTLAVMNTQVPLESASNPKRLTLQIFLDKSVMEVFVNDGQVCVTRVIYPPAEDLGVALFAEGEGAKIETLDVWEMKPIW